MATINLNPILDEDIDWVPSTFGNHYVLVDEGMARPNTSDYVTATVDKLLDSYKFNFADNGEDIVSLALQMYFTGTFPASYDIKFYLSDGVDINYPKTENPTEGVYKTGEIVLANNPFTGVPWTWAELVGGAYSFGFESVAGDGTGSVSVATFALQIITEVAGNKVIGDGLTNLI